VIDRLMGVEIDGLDLEMHLGPEEDSEGDVLLGGTRRLTTVDAFSGRGHAWLPEPRVEVYRDPRGRAEGAYVEFRTGKTARVERVGDSGFVFVCIGFDGEPVGVKMIHAAAEDVQSTVVYRLLANRSAEGGRGPVDLPISFVSGTIRCLKEASEELRRRVAAV
jgi:hypothetical protein